MGSSRKASASQSVCWELVQVGGVGDESQVTSVCGGGVLFPHVPLEWSCWQMGVRVLCAHLAWLSFQHPGLVCLGNEGTIWLGACPGGNSIQPKLVVFCAGTAGIRGGQSSNVPITCTKTISGSASCCLSCTST